MRAMLKLADEKNIEVLRQAALILDRENQKLIETNLELRRQLMKARNASPEEIQRELAVLEQELRQAVQKIVGGNSEKRPRGQGSDTPEPGEPQRGHGPRVQQELPIVEEIHLLDEADKRSCPSCGGALHEMKGQFEESDEITLVERRFVVVKHKRQKYACSCHAVIDTALAPQKLIEGGRYSIDFAIEVAVQKYLDHIPLERQVRIMAREGLAIDSQTLWDQLHALYTKLLPTWDRLHRYQLSQAVIGMDETHWKYLEKNGGEHEQKRWQAWTLVSEKAICYAILPHRDAAAARTLLPAFKGIVVADGYGVYEHLAQHDGITLVNCWAHTRRKFIELGEAVTDELRNEILDLIGELYLVERLIPVGADGLEQRRALRDERSRKTVERIRAWCLDQKQRILPRSVLASAIDYLFNRWTGLTRFLDDPRIPLDNNWSERALRGPVVGRKNHYGSKSERGTKVAALFYSLLESAKLVGINPKEYLRQAVGAALNATEIPLPHELAASAPSQLNA
jgi:transposase